MNIYIMEREDPDDIYSGNYFIEEFKEIERKDLRDMLERSHPYASYGEDFLRNILVVYYIGVAYLLEKKKYEIKFLAKRDYVSCRQARNKIKSEIDKNRERRFKQEAKRIDLDFENMKKNFSKVYIFMIAGGFVKHNKNFGKRSGKEAEEKSGKIKWKIDVWDKIARFRRNEKYWYYCRDIDAQIHIKEQLGI